MKHGTVIILNGTSSAGKTTLAAALQHALAEPYLHLGIDTFLQMLPTQYLNSTAFGASQVVVHRDGPHPRVEIRVGPVQHQMILGMYHAVAGLARLGNNVLLDDVIFDLRWLREAVEALMPFRVLFVGVHCPLAIAEQRERMRGDRVIGMARGLFEVVHRPGIYDLGVDTAAMSLEQCVQQVQYALHNPPATSAFQHIRVRLTSMDPTSIKEGVDQDLKAP